MNVLSPSILSADFAHLGEDMLAAVEAGAQMIHIDVMDGVFVPSISYGMPVISSIRKVTDATFDVHLMITDPIRYIHDFAECGADSITFHLESTKDPAAVIASIRKAGCRVGISIKPRTPLEALEPYLQDVDMILIMSVEPGFGGQKYITTSTGKIRQLRARLNELGLTTDIEVDGGVTGENLKRVLNAGANVIVAGSAIFKGDIRENVRSFLKVME